MLRIQKINIRAESSFHFASDSVKRLLRSSDKVRIDFDKFTCSKKPVPFCFDGFSQFEDDPITFALLEESGLNLTDVPASNR